MIGVLSIKTRLYWKTMENNKFLLGKKTMKNDLISDSGKGGE